MFITVPDGEIKKVWEEIINLDLSGKTICHCSGSLSSNIFECAEENGAYACSLHPLQAVSDKNSENLLRRCVFTIEGNKEKIEDIALLIKDLGNTVKVIDSEQKTLYHAAAVFASNLPAALVRTGVEMLMRCGFSEEEAQRSLAPLVVGSAKNIASKGPIAAMTGPVERNDVQTVFDHLSSICESEKEMYIPLTEKLAQMASIKNPERDYDKLKNIRRYCQ